MRNATAWLRRIDPALAPCLRQTSHVVTRKVLGMSVRLYAQYCRVLKDIPYPAEYADYEWYNLPRRMDVSLMPYGMMLGEFSSQIANDINALVNYTRRLQAWEVVMRPLGEKRILDALVEFVDPLTAVALGMPYAIRARFLYAAVHLNHQANQVRDGACWVDKLPRDRDIRAQHLDQLGEGWKSYADFRQAMCRIFDAAYQQSTRQYRHKYNHQVPPGIALGITGIVTRIVEKKTGRVSYIHGEAPPLTMVSIVQSLSEQCLCCREAFEQFKKMIGEHEAAIKAACGAKGQSGVAE